MNDIVHHKLQLPQTAADMKAHIQAIQQVMRETMIKDVHYGVIPGTKKPTLYKAGAEMLLTTFRISVQPEFEDLSGEDEVRYICRCKGIHMTTDTLVGIGTGSAGTGEERYKWRGCGPKEFEATPENRRRIYYKKGYDRGQRTELEIKQVRTEPADLDNTVLKMAKKRAEVDLCLTALACSDAFAQDLEDVERETPPQQGDPNADAPKPAAAYGEGMPDKATSKQIHLLKTKADQAGIREVDVWAHAKVIEWEQIKFSQVNELLDWFKSCSEPPV